VVKLHCSPTTSGPNALQRAIPFSAPSIRKSKTLHSWPSRSRHAATQMGPSGSTKVSISRPRIPPTGGLRKAIFMGERTLPLKPRPQLQGGEAVAIDDVDVPHELELSAKRAHADMPAPLEV